MSPAPFVLSAVSVDESAMAMSQASIELAYVLLPVWPSHMSLPLHCVVDPFTRVFPPVAPDVDPLSLDQIHVELALADRAIDQ